MISPAVEFGVGQHQSDACLLGSRSNDGRRIHAVVPMSPPRELRQHKLLIRIHGDHPLQPPLPWPRFLPVMMHAPHKERADRTLRQARRIDRHSGWTPSFFARAAQPAHRLADRPIDSLVVETLQKAIQSRENGHAHQPNAWRNSRHRSPGSDRKSVV
jgi:hypothetical protein